MGGLEPRGCPTPGACSCPVDPEALAEKIVAALLDEHLFGLSASGIAHTRVIRAIRGGS